MHPKRVIARFRDPESAFVRDDKVLPRPEPVIVLFHLFRIGQTRWEQGEDALLEHTIEGLNNMPPLGYCMDCEEADFLALIRFMGGER